MAKAPPIDPKLLEFCTDRQREALQAIIECGGVVGAAEKLGVCHAAVSKHLSLVRKKAALQGYAPEADMVHTTTLPFVVKGVSTYYDKDGDVRGQWVKTKLDGARVEAILREFVEDLVQDAKGKSPLIAAPDHADSDLLAVYPIGDPHFGMYAWGEEAGEDFDTNLAEQITTSTVSRLITASPPAETAILLCLGDLIHADNSTARTPQAGNQLDVDTRWARVMRIGLRTLIFAIKAALVKHQKVKVRFNKGNHDPHAYVGIALAVEAYFNNNPRVEIDLSPAVHWYYRFGKVLLGSTHGDTTREKELLGVMAADVPQEWGASVYRYWYCGHIHHTHKQEFPGGVVEYFRTLAPQDAWSAAKGYRAGRDMSLIVHHRDFGEIERHRCDIGMLKAA